MKERNYMLDKKVTIGQFLTNEQIIEAFKLKKASPICEQVIKPNLKEINEKLGQDNDPMYLAYMIEYLINKDKRQ